MSATAAKLDAAEVKRMASGRWGQILRSIGGLTDAQLSGRHGPCPKCGGNDRFRALDDFHETGGLICNQCFNKGNSDGFSALQWLLDIRFPEALRRVADFVGMANNGHHKTATPARKKTSPAADETLSASFLKGLQASGKETLHDLAESLNVSHSALEDLGVGYLPDQNAWTWPEREADGKVCGINRRFEDGSKKVMRGHRRGLYYQDGWQEHEGPILIVEGGSDTAAGITIGLSTIGRPSAIVPRDLLSELVTMLQTVSNLRPIIVLGERDQNAEGKWPGREGAIRTAEELTEALGREVKWALPPKDVKDLRAWIRAEPEKSGHELLAGLVFEAEAKESKLVFHDAWRAAHKPKPLREVIIEGLLRRGEVGNVIAATKIGKSWFALLLEMCVSLGRDWLGRRVAKGNVLLIDNELHEETLENRLAALRAELQIDETTPRGEFKYLCCRGKWLSLAELIEEVSTQYAPGYLNLIVIDAKYRLFGNGLEENSNDDQTEFHNQMDVFASRMNCAILLVHHSSKGDQNGKAVTDVGSGGGSQARTVDLHLTIRPHQTEGLAVMDAAVRSFPKVEPVTLRWTWPVWELAEGVKPVLCKDAKEQGRRAEMEERVRKYLSEDWTTLSKLAERCGTKKERNPFADIIDELEASGEIERTDSFIPPNTKKEAEAVRLTADNFSSDTVRSP